MEEFHNEIETRLMQFKRNERRKQPNNRLT